MAFEPVLGVHKWRDQVGLVSTMDQLNAPQGKVLLHSDSGSMWAGFDQMYGGFIPDPPPGYTTMRVFPGETHSLMLSSGERPYTDLSPGTRQRDRGTTVYSRLTWQPGKWKRLHLCTTFTVLGTEVYSWSAISLGFDIQNWDNSDRAHFRAQLEDPYAGTPTVDHGLPQWRIANNNEGGNFWTGVPNSRPSMTGENEDKGGWNFARLSVDLEHIQAGSTHNGGEPDTIGRYLELQCNDKVFDLTGIAGVGQGWQDPQDGDPIGDYRGGCNPGIGAWRSTRNPDRIPNVLFGPIYVIAEAA